MKSINNYIAEHLFSGKKVSIKNQIKDIVDLDLPSGTLWCTHNIGANKPEEPGDYFAWGETETKKEYTWDNYVFGTTYQISQGNKLNPYTKENQTLDIKDDVANVILGNDYCIPSKDQLQELIDYTNVNWVYLNHKEGYKFVSKTDETKWIFIPTGGEWSTSYNPVNVNDYIAIWTSTLAGLSRDGNVGLRAFALDADDSQISISREFRRNGFNIRPVLKK